MPFGCSMHLILAHANGVANACLEVINIYHCLFCIVINEKGWFSMLRLYFFRHPKCSTSIKTNLLNSKSVKEDLFAPISYPTYCILCKMYPLRMCVLVTWLNYDFYVHPTIFYRNILKISMERSVV